MSGDIQKDIAAQTVKDLFAGKDSSHAPFCAVGSAVLCKCMGGMM